MAPHISKLTSEPVHQQVYQRLREMVLHGELAPGQAVTIIGLSDQMQASMTPIREAIRRLTAEGALELLGNRRVQVPVMTLHKLEQLLFARLALEPHLAQIGAGKATEADVAELNALDEELGRAISTGDTLGYMRFNYGFHARLYALSGAETLLQIVDGLWMQAAPSLRAMCGLLGTKNLPDMHVATLDAIRAGNLGAAREAIAADIEQGMHNIRSILEERHE